MLYMATLEGGMQSSVVEQIRSFNRFYTGQIGLLEEHLSGSQFTLSEARVLFELAQSPEQTAAQIIRSLNIDKAHISRIVSRLQAAGLVKSRISPEHGKHKLLSLSSAGKKAFKGLDQNAKAQIEALVAHLSKEQQLRLAKEMSDIRKMLANERASSEEVELRSLKVGDMGWIAHRQAVLYHTEFGWDWTYEALVSQILGDFALHFDDSREDAWVAHTGSEIVGSVFLMKSDNPEVAKLRLLYVEPSARGLGVGSRLVKCCIERARALGYQKLTLWTSDNLTSARKLYTASGFELIEEDSGALFGKELVFQTWTLDLRGS
jgi:DNA-binding MarR family transcriptional regulator/N-acetylglutamate synthase-like GNAT family acetyltransferase